MKINYELDTIEKELLKYLKYVQEFPVLENETRPSWSTYGDGGVDFKHLEMLTYLLSQSQKSYADLVMPIADSLFDIPDDWDGWEKYNLKKFFEMLEFLGYASTYGLGAKLTNIQLTDAGLKLASKIAKGKNIILNPIKQTDKTIFVASAFGRDDVDLLFKNEIAPICNELGYTPIRIDMKEHDRTITEAMIDEINKCTCIIGDLTYARPSVYFEIGYAHGIGVPLILTARNDHENNFEDDSRIHFDLKQYKISHWEIGTDNKISWRKDQEIKSRIKNLNTGI